MRNRISRIAAVLLTAVTGGLLLSGCASSRATLSRGNGQVVRRYFEEWANGGSARVADELIATNLVLWHPHITVTGLEAYKKSMASFHAAFPDLHFATEDQIAEGDKVLVRWTMTGTQRGEFQGRAASAKSVRVAGMSLFRLGSGRIQEIWVNMDRLAFQEQLGWLPAPVRAAEAGKDGWFELRLYTVTSNKLDAFRNRWRDFAVPIYERHGLHSVGWWIAEKKDADGNDQFVCLLAAGELGIRFPMFATV